MWEAGDGRGVEGSTLGVGVGGQDEQKNKTKSKLQDLLNQLSNCLRSR